MSDKSTFKDKQFYLCLTLIKQSDIPIVWENIEDNSDLLDLHEWVIGKHQQSKQKGIHWHVSARITINTDTKYKDVNGLQRKIKRDLFKFLSKGTYVSITEIEDHNLDDLPDVYCYPFKEYEDMDEVLQYKQGIEDENLLERLRIKGNNVYQATLKSKEYQQRSQLRSFKVYEDMECAMIDIINTPCRQLPPGICFTQLCIHLTMYCAKHYPSQPKNIKGLALNMLTNWYSDECPAQLAEFLIQYHGLQRFQH